jgi:hypothetical protein
MSLVSPPSPRVATRDLGDLASHPPGLFTGEQHYDVCDVRRPAQTTQRNGRQQLTFHFRRDVAGLNWTRRDGVDSRYPASILARKTIRSIASSNVAFCGRSSSARRIRSRVVYFGMVGSYRHSPAKEHPVG